MANNYLIWLRQDLRITDNTALAACCQAAQQAGAGVLAVVYLTPSQWQLHDKSLWQIDLILRQIAQLKQSLAALNIGLVVRTVADFAIQAQDVVALCQQNAICQLFANREYLDREIIRDRRVHTDAQQIGVQTNWYDDSTIVAPQRVLTNQGQPYKVFTPFYKRWLALLETAPLMPAATPAPNALDTTALAATLTPPKQALTIAEFYQAFYQPTPSLDEQLAQVQALGETLYPAGEVAAQARLDELLQHDIAEYNSARDVPALHDHLGATSRLSPYLAAGVLSARLCYVKARQQLDVLPEAHKDIYRWISELAWRDFYVDVIVNRPDIVKGQAFLVETDTAVTWRYDEADFAAWCAGRTGVPLVDAAMRCLNATGFMHNRLRMVVAMYLSKNLLIDWRWGERYFMQQLVDGDFASNNGGWQWSASVGTDAQPYFRVMNPFSQAASHDVDAAFIKHWLPELAAIPAKILHDETKLQQQLAANPAIDYPRLDTPTKVTRKLAIEAFKHAF